MGLPLGGGKLGLSNQEKKAYLKQYRSLDVDISQKLDEIERLKSLVGKITTTISDMPRGSSSIYKAGDAAIVDKIVDLEAEINRDMKGLIKLREQIMTAIMAVDDANLRQLLIYRYVEGRTFEDIACTMQYSWRWVCALHGQALEKVSVHHVSSYCKRATL